MAGGENRAPNKGGDNKGNDPRKSRRRYFRRKGDDAQLTEIGSDTPPERIAGQPPHAADRNPQADKRARNNRRRRRSKSKRPGGEVRSAPPAETAADIAYVPPASVYIYTHVVRPDARESYEFRSEHFSSVGRKLEDYDIDLSSLFDEAGRVKTLSIPAEAVRLLRELENEAEDADASAADASAADSPAGGASADPAEPLPPPSSATAA